MKLTVLIDNNTYIDEYYIGEPALSYYIEDENERLLFDTGYSDAFIRECAGDEYRFICNIHPHAFARS